MNFRTVLALVFVLILATNGAQINPAQQQVLLEIYNACSPNCPSSISSGACDLNSTSINQCLCSYISCDSNGNITSLYLYFTFYTTNHKHKPKTEQVIEEMKEKKAREKDIPIVSVDSVLEEGRREGTKTCLFRKWFLFVFFKNKK